jgi:hypothetical protein
MLVLVLVFSIVVAVMVYNGDRGSGDDYNEHGDEFGGGGGGSGGGGGFDGGLW